MEPRTQPKAHEFAALVDALRELLASQDSLPAERQLAEQLQVKRHQLRRALELLRTNGELNSSTSRRKPTLLRGGEAMVRSTNPLEVIELRMIIEPALARLAALRATPLQVMQIDHAATTRPSEESGHADLTFHKLIATAAGNALAADLYSLLRQVGRDARLRVQSSTPTCPNRVRQRDAEHRAIAAAIAARNPIEAENSMRLHLEAVKQQVLTGVNFASNVA